MSRREFIGTASTAAFAAAAFGRGAIAGAAGEVALPPGYTKTRVLRIFIGTHPAWPRPDLKVTEEIDRIRGEIDKVPGLEDIEFVSNEWIKDVNALKAALDKNRDADGVLAVQVCMGTTAVLNALADSGIPTIHFSIPYSGHEWHIVPDLQLRGKKIDSIPTSNFADVAPALRPLRAIHRLKETRILYVSGGPPAPQAIMDDAKQKFGLTIRTLDHRMLVSAYEAQPNDAVAAETEDWIANAREVRGPAKEEIAKSARMCLALQKVLANEKAQAITINCLGLFGMRALPAYPCFGFARLNDLGLTGVCEADIPSTLTQVIFLHLTGKPGFVTDPMFDTSNNTLIHAHCVAATRMDGPQGERAPYVIRTHLEDDKGAVLQVFMRTGGEITMAKLVGGNREQIPTSLAASPAECLGTTKMLLSTGKLVDAPNSDRGCRTQIVVKVANARKMFEQWSYGLHRVIFFGDHTNDVRRLARFTGFEIVEEC